MELTDSQVNCQVNWMIDRQSTVKSIEKSRQCGPQPYLVYLFLYTRCVQLSVLSMTVCGQYVHLSIDLRAESPISLFLNYLDSWLSLYLMATDDIVAVKSYMIILKGPFCLVMGHPMQYPAHFSLFENKKK